MNVFILNSGRCGSTTFIRACGHINNYTSAHESGINHVGPDRLTYPEQHIEADNRLSWFTGRLDQLYGDSAFYVHLMRNTEETIRSFVKRSDIGIMKAYREGIYLCEQPASPETYASDYINTVNSNIKHFLRDKTHKMDFHLEHAKEDFRSFWEQIKAEGDIESALSEWDVHYNHSSSIVAQT